MKRFCFYKGYCVCSLDMYSTFWLALLLVNPRVSFELDKGRKEPAQRSGCPADLPVPPAAQTLFLVSQLPEISSLPSHSPWPHAATGV